MPKREASEPLAGCSRKKSKTSKVPIDLTYPYNYTPDSGSDLNPPFLSSNGPLYDSGSGLTLKCSAPLDISNKSVVLKTDNTLAKNEKGELGVKLDCQGPIIAGDNGLDIDHDNTLETDNWKLSVNFAPHQPISVTTNGMTINVDDTMLIEANEENEYELGVHLNLNGPITADQEGIDLEIDNQTMQVIEGALGIKHAAPIVVQPNTGITVDTDNTLALQNSKLRVNTVAPIVAKSNGVALDIDESKLAVQNNKLTIRHIAMPIATFEAGDPTLRSYDGLIRAQTQTGISTWQVAYYIYMVNCAGMVTANVTIKMDRSKLSTGGVVPNNYINLCYILNPNVTGGNNPSTISNPTIVPSNAMLSFVPSDKIQRGYVVNPSTFFNGPWSGGNVEIRFYPVTTGKTFILSYCLPYPARLNGTSVIAFTFDLRPQSNWFEQSNSTCIMGPLIYTYQASMPPTN